MNTTQIRKLLLNSGVKVSNTRITKTAMELGILGDTFTEEQARNIINALKQSAPPTQRRATSKQPSTDQVEGAMVRSEGAIANVVQNRINHINAGVEQLGKKLEAYEEGVADAVVNRLKQSQARIYCRIEDKLAQEEGDLFSLDALVEEFTVVPEIQFPGLAGTVPAAYLPEREASEVE